MNHIDHLEYKELIGQGLSQRKAALVLDIPRTTIQGYLKRMADKDEIAEQYLELPETYVDKVENSKTILYLNAKFLI